MPDIPRKVLGYLVLLVAFLLISWSLSPWAPVTYAAGFKVLADDSGIKIISKEPVYTFDNMAPGDSTVIEIEVINESNQSCSLVISTDVVEADAVPLYDKLQVLIKGKYSGPLSDLQKVSLGSFAASSTSSLQLVVLLPTDVGNEVQALTLSGSIVIHLDAPGSGGGTPPEERLPVTGTRVNWLLPLGLLLFLIGLLVLVNAKNEIKE